MSVNNAKLLALSFDFFSFYFFLLAMNKVPDNLAQIVTGNCFRWSEYPTSRIFFSSITYSENEWHICPYRQHRLCCCIEDVAPEMTNGRAQLRAFHNIFPYLTIRHCRRQKQFKPLRTRRPSSMTHNAITEKDHQWPWVDMTKAVTPKTSFTLCRNLGCKVDRFLVGTSSRRNGLLQKWSCEVMWYWFYFGS